MERNEPFESIRRVRRKLRAFIAFEWLQMSLAIGTLLAIAARAILEAEDQGAAVSTSAAVILALAYIALSVRIRMGQERIRQELYALEHDPDDASATTHPYRSSCRGEIRWRDWDWKEAANNPINRRERGDPWTDRSGTSGRPSSLR